MTRVRTCPRSRMAGRPHLTRLWFEEPTSRTSVTPVMTWWAVRRWPVRWTSAGTLNLPSVRRVSRAPLVTSLLRVQGNIYFHVCLVFFSPSSSLVMYCTDPGHVEHSTRILSDPKLLVGTTIQYSCIPGFILQGGATLTCYGREPGTPVWTSRLPHCVCECCECRIRWRLFTLVSCGWKFVKEMCFIYLCALAQESVSCENPGLPDNGYQILSKRLYLPGESLTFVCYQGYELIGEMAIKCIMGNPSFWSGPLPLCRGTHTFKENKHIDFCSFNCDGCYLNAHVLSNLKFFVSCL